MYVLCVTLLGTAIIDEQVYAASGTPVRRSKPSAGGETSTSPRSAAVLTRIRVGLGKLKERIASMKVPLRMQQAAAALMVLGLMYNAYTSGDSVELDPDLTTFLELYSEGRLCEAVGVLTDMAKVADMCSAMPSAECYALVAMFEGAVDDQDMCFGEESEWTDSVVDWLASWS